MKIKIYQVSGPEGNCLVLHDYRIAGPKPWGGGKIVKEWNVEINDLLHAINGVFDPVVYVPKTVLEEIEVLKNRVQQAMAEGKNEHP